MPEQATATFDVKSWDEKPYNESEGFPKMTRATVVTSYEGDIAGEGALEYLMVYRDDGVASFTGMERVVGSIAERSGSFVLQHVGTFEGGTAKIISIVIPGAGTGDLSGLRGSASFEPGKHEHDDFKLSYNFE